jgi:hypothetical protein
VLDKISQNSHSQEVNAKSGEPLRKKTGSEDEYRRRHKKLARECPALGCRGQAHIAAGDREWKRRIRKEVLEFGAKIFAADIG